MSWNTSGRLATLVALGIFSFIASRSAEAAPIVYGNFPGATIDYLGVQEESVTDPGPGLFGPPTVAGDAMDFNPNAFAASTSGLASDTTDSNLQFTVMAHPGQAINGINFTEAGDQALSGLVGEAMTTVGTVITGEITEVLIGNVLTPVNINLPQVVMGFNPKNSWKLSVDGPGSKGWTGAAFVNLVGNGLVTKVHISLDNTLTAASVAGTSAFIQKKDADALIITTTTTPFIPEPGSAVIAMIAMALCGMVLRRR